MIETTSGALYTGITTNVERRYAEHLSVFQGTGVKGAKYFRGHEPKRVVYQECFESRSMASKREYQIKQLTKKQKAALIAVSG